MHPILIVAHRGGRSEFHENTLKAFEYGLSHGANAVEMDVRFDKINKRFYLEHDFIHSPKDRKNIIDKIIPFLPKESMLFIELKTVSWLSPRYAIQFAEVIEKYALAKRAVVMSFNPFVLLQLKRLNSKLQFGFLCRSAILGIIFSKWIFRKLKPEFLMLHRRMLKPKILKFAHNHKIKVLSFTLNHQADWLKVKELQLAGVITDFPAEAKELLSMRKSKT